MLRKIVPIVLLISLFAANALAIRTYTNERDYTKFDRVLIQDKISIDSPTALTALTAARDVFLSRTSCESVGFEPLDDVLYREAHPGFFERIG